MKWKTALTAEEAALISAQLHEFHPRGFQTLRDFEYYCDQLEARIGGKGTFIDDDGDFIDTPEQQQLDQMSDRLAEALEIKEGLEREIHGAWLRLGLGNNKDIDLDLDRDCTLVLANWFDSLDYINDFTVTKISLAEWFHKMGDPDKAKIFDLNFESNNSVKKEAARNYPKKLQLAIDAHTHFWLEQDFRNQHINEDVQRWVYEKALELGLTYSNGTETLDGISEIVAKVLAQIIKPDKK
jgi:hypothetical protein